MAEPVSTTRPWSLAGIQGFINRTWKSRFVRNVAVVASGTAGAQAIVIAFSPIITRLYGPEAFGILGTFMAIVAVITPIAALSYPIAIVLPKEDSDARGIARLSAYIALGVAALTALVLLIFGNHIVSLLQVQEVSSYIWLFPLVILFAAWLQINQQWVIRKKHFGVKALDLEDEKLERLEERGFKYTQCVLQNASGAKCELEGLSLHNASDAECKLTAEMLASGP